ncbi:hypothetical protein [Inquilinus limosus]|nr:hypothetical protein [Inquilinus limosus]
MRRVLNWMRLLAAAMGDDDGHERELHAALRKANRGPNRCRRPLPDPEV